MTKSPQDVLADAAEAEATATELRCQKLWPHTHIAEATTSTASYA